MSTLRIAFLHLAPCLRDLQANRRLIDRAVTTAATSGATWILTSELCICGYDFTDDLGTAWIVPPPDPWMTSLCQRAASLGVTVFLSHPERDAQSGKCYNTLFVIAADGRVAPQVTDARTPTPGLRIFDAVTDRELTTTPLNVGQFPPTWTLFIE
jgi:predicted amidohydrolase